MKQLNSCFTIAFFILLSFSAKAQLNGTYKINSLKNGLSLQEDGSKVLLRYQNNTNVQKWSLTKISSYGENLFEIKNMANNKVMAANKTDTNKNGRPIALRKPGREDSKKWYIRSIGSNRYIIINKKNSKALSFKNGNYSTGLRAELNNNIGSMDQTWVLEPVKNTSVQGDFVGIYKKDYGYLNMEIIKTSSNTYKALFRGSCKDESLNGRINSNGVLVIPLKSNNNARLEIRSQNNRVNVSITNISAMSQSRSSNTCTGGAIEGYYTRQITKMNYAGYYKLNYGKQNLQIISTNSNSFKAVFSGDCKAETLSGKVNKKGVLIIPLRGGYKDELRIRKKGKELNITITNKNVMRSSCNGANIEGIYIEQNGFGNSIPKYFLGNYQMDKGLQFMKIESAGFNKYKAVFSGDCNAFTLAGSFDARGDLIIPLQGGYNDFIRIYRKGNKLSVTVSNRTVMKNSCKGATVEGLYSLRSSNGNIPISNKYSGNYRMNIGKQYMKITQLSSNTFRAVFTGSCNAQTATGRINNTGTLEFPLQGGFNDKLYIQFQGKSLRVTVTNENLMRTACKGQSIIGVYTKNY